MVVRRASVPLDLGRLVLSLQVRRLEMIVVLNSVLVHHLTRVDVRLRLRFGRRAQVVRLLLEDGLLKGTLLLVLHLVRECCLLLAVEVEIIVTKQIGFSLGRLALGRFDSVRDI